MDVNGQNWQWMVGVLIGVVALSVIGWKVWSRRARAQASARRIAAARVHSGYVPPELPTVRATLAGASADIAPDTLPQGGGAIVDEHPLLQLKFFDADGKKTVRTVQVERLDLQRKVIVGRDDPAGEAKRFPIDRVLAARIAQTGRSFDVDTWVNAVRVARRRRNEP